MIARIWRGVVRAQDAAGYADYIRQTGLSGYKKTPGNHGAWLLQRIEDDRAELGKFRARRRGCRQAPVDAANGGSLHVRSEIVARFFDVGQSRTLAWAGPPAGRCSGRPAGRS